MIDLSVGADSDHGDRPHLHHHSSNHSICSQLNLHHEGVAAACETHISPISTTTPTTTTWSAGTPNSCSMPAFISHIDADGADGMEQSRMLIAALRPLRALSRLTSLQSFMDEGPAHEHSWRSCAMTKSRSQSSSFNAPAPQDPDLVWSVAAPFSPLCFAPLRESTSTRTNGTARTTHNGNNNSAHDASANCTIGDVLDDDDDDDDERDVQLDSTDSLIAMADWGDALLDAVKDGSPLQQQDEYPLQMRSVNCHDDEDESDSPHWRSGKVGSQWGSSFFPSTHSDTWAYLNESRTSRGADGPLGESHNPRQYAQQQQVVPTFRAPTGPPLVLQRSEMQDHQRSPLRRHTDRPSCTHPHDVDVDDSPGRRCSALITMRDHHIMPTS